MKFARVRGINLALPEDALNEEWLSRAENIAMAQQGAIQARPGITLSHSSAVGPAHSMFRLDQNANFALQSYARFVGADTRLYSDNNVHASALVERDSGYSGDPLFMAAARPRQSPEPWLFIADRSRKRKVRVNGDDFAWGRTHVQGDLGLRGHH
jgi:hypothetical protein